MSTTTLARQAERLSLGDHLLLGRGEEKTGGRRKQALLADGYEALIAAIYLDGGIEQARAFIAREFAPLVDDVAPATASSAQDYKSALQELLQARDRPLPEYRLAGTVGPDHRKLFQVEVVVGGEALARGDAGRARRKRSRKRRGWRSRNRDSSRIAVDLDDSRSALQSISMMPQACVSSPTPPAAAMRAPARCCGRRGSA